MLIFYFILYHVIWLLNDGSHVYKFSPSEVASKSVTGILINIDVECLYAFQPFFFFLGIFLPVFAQAHCNLLAWEEDKM